MNPIDYEVFRQLLAPRLRVGPEWLVVVLAGFLLGICGCGSDRQSAVAEWGGLEVVQGGENLNEATDIIVLLHGMGGNASGMAQVCQRFQMSPSTALVFPEGPLSARDQGRAWMLSPADFEPSRAKVLELLKYVKLENPDARIVLGGYSQGAIICSNLICQDEASPLVDAVVLMSPSGQIRHETSAGDAHKPLIFLSHGKSDRVLPFDGSRGLHKKLVENGYEVDWYPYRGGHGLPPGLTSRLNKFLERVQNGQASVDG